MGGVKSEFEHVPIDINRMCMRSTHDTHKCKCKCLTSLGTSALHLSKPMSASSDTIHVPRLLTTTCGRDNHSSIFQQFRMLKSRFKAGPTEPICLFCVFKKDLEALGVEDGAGGGGGGNPSAGFNSSLVVRD